MTNVCEVTESQIIGDCKRPCIKTFNNLSGRPMSVIIINPATIAKATAIISAIRVKGLTHLTPSKPITELMSIPIRLAATKNTKLEM